MTPGDAVLAVILIAVGWLLAATLLGAVRDRE